MIERLVWWLARRYFLRRIDAVLSRAHARGAINSWLLHELDHRLKYEPGRPWEHANRTAYEQAQRDAKRAARAVVNGLEVSA